VISGEMLRDLGIDSVEWRFGPAYTAHPWRRMAQRQWQLLHRQRNEVLRIWDSLVASHRSEVPNLTAWPKPSSRLKRDDVYVHDRSETVMSQLDEGFEDYNEYRAHKGL
jgi:hypothetical protein